MNVHRITAPWSESTATWNNFGGYDPYAWGSFAGSPGWQSVDVTSLAQAWSNGTYPNYGILLGQGSAAFTEYHSRESPALMPPTLEICYTAIDGSSCIALDAVADTYIWESLPNSNLGTAHRLFTGLVYGAEKQSLVQFEFSVECGQGCTPGYWKNHLGSWVGYSPEDVFDDVFVTAYFGPDFTLEDPVNARGGGLNALARHATAALLNVANPAVDYGQSEGQVIARAQLGTEVAKNELNWYNEVGCPLD